MGKPRQLLGDQLVAVDETQPARVQRHRPSPRGTNYLVLTDIHCMPRQIAEILDHRYLWLRFPGRFGVGIRGDLRS